eukprot:TRINITY_DN661_c0_g4_i1.p1 TRINITY_DN661_c0_g4~~TRINITY_DN661_c0_g4_i1.p1  ORF type:complete len:241 (+),score=57.06 TRINITY_DN661_c0_g4_i1:35-757(+)
MFQVPTAQELIANDQDEVALHQYFNYMDKKTLIQQQTQEQEAIKKKILEILGQLEPPPESQVSESQVDEQAQLLVKANKELVDELTKKKGWFTARRWQAVWVKPDVENPGLYLMKDVDESVTPISQQTLDTFWKKATHVKDGWLKYFPSANMPDFQAARVGKDFQIVTLDGVVKGTKIDYLCRESNKEEEKNNNNNNNNIQNEAKPEKLWIVEGKMFNKTYQQIMGKNQIQSTQTLMKIS